MIVTKQSELLTWNAGDEFERP